MVIAAPEPKAELQPVGEQRVVLRGLSWEVYLQILGALPQSRSSRLTYDDLMAKSGGFISSRKGCTWKLRLAPRFLRCPKNDCVPFWSRRKRMKLKRCSHYEPGGRGNVRKTAEDDRAILITSIGL